MDVDANGVSCNVHPFALNSKQKVKQMQIYLVIKAGLIVLSQKTADVLEGRIKKNFDKLVDNGCFTSVEKENFQKASPGAKQPMAAHSIW